MTQDQVDRLTKELKDQLGNDVLTQYVNALEDRFGVRINEAALHQAAGDENPQSRWIRAEGPRL